MRSSFISSALIFFFLFLSNILPDEILLKDGTKLKGEFLEFSGKYAVIKEPSGKNTAVLRTEIVSIQVQELPGQEKKESGAKEELLMELSVEIVSDFVWRGNSYGGEYLSRRNNLPYKSVNEYWALQPNLRINTPLTGYYFEFWGNFALLHRSDRDSDLRILQASPGGQNIDPAVYFTRAESAYKNGSLSDLNALFFDPANNVYSSKCTDPANSSVCNPSASIVNPLHLGAKREKNGMNRTDGLFTTFAYQFENKRYGDLTAGIWFYTQFDKNSKNTWQEFFFNWGLPVFQKVIKPVVSLYTQVSYDGGGNNAGGQYISYSMSHEFLEGKFFRIQPSTNLGYKYVNNNREQRSGFYDFTNKLRFSFGDFFFSLNYVLRPDVYMFDNSQFYYTNSAGSNAVADRNPYDGRTVDPSRLYGSQNEAVYSAINSLNQPEIVKQILKENYQSQKIVNHFFYITFGYSTRF